MPHTRARSVVEVRIIEASVQLFAQGGFRGTSTRQIAHLADVSEATLFRHFPRKAALFWAAAESQLRQLKLGMSLHSSLANDLDPAQVIPQIVDYLLATMVQQPDLLRLLYVAVTELRGSEPIFREHLGPIFESLNRYFSRCIARGMVCDIDPPMLTLGIAAAVGGYRSLYELFSDKTSRWNMEKVARGYSQLWLNAVRQQVPEAQLR